MRECALDRRVGVAREETDEADRFRILRFEPLVRERWGCGCHDVGEVVERRIEGWQPAAVEEFGLSRHSYYELVSTLRPSPPAPLPVVYPHLFAC